MPHLILEYTDNLAGSPLQDCLLQLNRILLASGEFEPVDIKSRAVPLRDVQVGVEPGVHAFVHVTLALLSGRSEETRQNLSKGLLQALQDTPWKGQRDSLQLSVNVMDMPRTTYSKAFA